jgi:hypothetical protein
MFWSRPKKDDSKDLREKNIQELKGAFPSVKRPNNDDSLFEIITTTNGSPNTIRIYIPQDFPNTKPGISNGYVK